MTLNEFLEVIKIGFQILMDLKIFGIPLLVIFSIVAILGLIVLFLKGKK